MFKENGRLSIKRTGVVSDIVVNDDGKIVASVGGIDYVISNPNLAALLRTYIGSDVTIEGYKYSDTGELHINDILD